jgi:hypothetical protein
MFPAAEPNIDVRKANLGWLAMNDPVHAERLHSKWAVASYAAVLATIGYAVKPVIQKAVLLGRERETVLQHSRALKGQLHTAAGLERFKLNPMDGCTSIMNMARAAAGFNPLERNPQRQHDTYEGYLRALMMSPLFRLSSDGQMTVSRQTNDWSVLLEAILGCFDGVGDEDRNSIRISLIDLANVAASHQGQTQSDDLFVQSVLHADGANEYSAGLYTSRVSMRSDTNKGATSSQTDFQIRRTRLTFSAQDWPVVAADVWARQVTTVVDWLDSNTNNTAAGSTVARLCI